MTNAATQGVDAVMISNNAGEQIQSGVDAAVDADVAVVSWDSPIPSGEGESLFVAQVDFDETGVVMADMALEIIGEDGGQFAVLSASPDAANQNAWIEALETALEDEKYASLELVDTVYGNDDADESYNQALALVDSHPDLELIMAPTTVGIAAAGKAMTDEGLCDQVKVSGLGLPDEMREYTESGCAPQFALWSFVDLGYLTYYADLRHRHGPDGGRRGPDVHGRAHGRVHDRAGSDPGRRPAGGDGSVHRLHRGERRVTGPRGPSGPASSPGPARAAMGAVSAHSQEDP